MWQTLKNSVMKWHTLSTGLPNSSHRQGNLTPPRVHCRILGWDPGHLELNLKSHWGPKYWWFQKYFRFLGKRSAPKSLLQIMHLLGSWSVLGQVASPVCSGPSTFWLIVPFGLTRLFILYLEGNYHKWEAGAEAKNLQDLFGYLIVTLTTETRSHLGDHSVVAWRSPECLA